MIWLPQPIRFEQGVCQDEELSHDGGDCGFDELLVFGFYLRLNLQEGMGYGGLRPAAPAPARRV